MIKKLYGFKLAAGEQWRLNNDDIVEIIDPCDSNGNIIAKLVNGTASAQDSDLASAALIIFNGIGQIHDEPMNIMTALRSPMVITNTTAVFWGEKPTGELSCRIFKQDGSADIFIKELIAADEEHFVRNYLINI